MTPTENYQLAYVVVDDDEDDRFILRMALKEANRPLPIHEFPDGQDFIDYLTQHGDDSLSWLVVLDVNMPRLNGLDTLKLLRQNSHWSKFPVLMLSTSDDPSLIEQSYRYGANGYVVKPSSSAEFVNIFDQFFAPLLVAELNQQ